MNSNYKFKRRSGYTLIEMLITITIFSGLLILVLGSFASTSSSSAKVNVLREKSQTTRKIIDQISTDFRYVDIDRKFKVGSTTYTGFRTTPSNDLLEMTLLYPDQVTAINKLYVIKTYQSKVFNNHQTITLIERRDCRFNPENVPQCDNGKTSAYTDILDAAYQVNINDPNHDTFFKGVTPSEAQNSNITPFISLSLTIKHSSISLQCGNTTLDAGTCYKLETKILPGVKL